jgi:hypothetical protein
MLGSIVSPFENLLRLVTACLVLTSLSPVRAGLEKEILGQWQYKGKQVGADIESVAKFEEGGAYACEMKVNLFGTQTKIQFKGTWRVEEEKHVVIEVTETSSPFFLPKGKIMRKESVKIEEDVMAYQYAGNPEREVRVKEPAEPVPMPMPTPVPCDCDAADRPGKRPRAQWAHWAHWARGCGCGRKTSIAGTVNANSAAREGGGLWNGSGTITVEGVEIAGNNTAGPAADDGRRWHL